MDERIQKILEVANQAYENGELRIDEDIPDFERGDGLASFIRREIIEVLERNEDLSAKELAEMAYQAIQRSTQQLEDVEEALGCWLQKVDL